MNRYLVIRHIKGAGHDSTTNFAAYADSERQAISQTRYTTTKCDKWPNGEPTDYTRADGAHIWWTAELVGKEPTKAPDMDGETLPEPEAATPIEDAIGKASGEAVVKAKRAKAGESIDAESNKPEIHTYVNGDDVEKLKQIKGELGLPTYVDVIRSLISWWLNGAPGSDNETPDVLSDLPKNIKDRLKAIAKIRGCSDDEIVRYAVRQYADRIGQMTFSELIEEAYND